MSSLDERLARARIDGPDAAATDRARRAALAAVSPASRRVAGRRVRPAQAGIAALALAAVAAAILAIVASRGRTPEAPRPASTTAPAGVDHVGALRGVRSAPRASRLPGWLAQAYGDAQGGGAPAGPVRLLVTASGQDRDAIYVWPTRAGGLTLAAAGGVETLEPRQQLPVLTVSSGDDRMTPSGIGVLPGRHRPLVAGLVADDVVAVAVRVDGTFHPAALAHDAFGYQLPHATTAGSADAVRLTRADGSSRTVPIPGAKAGAIVLGRGQASDAGDAMSVPASWHLPSPPRRGATTVSGPPVDLVAASAVVPAPIAYRDGCPVLPEAIAPTTSLVLVARWPAGSGDAPAPGMTWARRLGLAAGAVPCWPGRSSIIDLADAHGDLALRITVLMAPRETELLRRQTRAVVESVGLTTP